VKGVVFNLLEQIVTREYGEDTWDELLDSAGLEGAYTSLGSYGDADLGKLVDAASGALEISPDEVVRWLGRNALPLFAVSHPKLFERHTSSRTFVLTLNDIIHPEVRKLYPGADVPVFDFASTPTGDLVLGYRSARKMCTFAEGLLEGAADHFGEQVVIEQPRCMKRGDEDCVIEIAFVGNGIAP
jgi:Haem-NO-binding